MSISNSTATNHDHMEDLFKKHGFSDFKWMNPKDIIVSQWVRMKCMYGCGDCGKKAACPPNVPSVIECEKFFNEYKKAVVFHFQKQVEKLHLVQLPGRLLLVMPVQQCQCQALTR